MPLTRRELLQRLSLITGGLAIAGGTSWCVFGPPGRREDEGALPFAVWREMREALRRSPDHLAARADRLVLAGDPGAIFAFVRNQVATYPASDLTIAAERGTRWGVRGALRCGAGTPREKAELLAELFRRAGWETEVLVGGVPLPPGAVQQELWRSPDRPFDPPMDATTMARWHRRLELPRPLPHKLTAVDEGGSESGHLADSLGRQFPPPDRVRPFNWRWNDTPIVRATKDGQTFYANLFAADTPFGEAGVDPARLRPARPAETLPEVTITLAMAVAAAPLDRLPLVEGRWSLGDLVGRQVVVQMQPGLDFRSLAAASFQDVRVFIPTLRVQAFDLDRERSQAMSVTGDAVTRDGARITTTPEGGVALDGREVVGPAATASVEQVVSLDLHVNSSHAPLIHLDVRATDASGAAVEGLDASAFSLADNDREVSFLLRSSRAAPRIALLVDQSGSMPSEYRGAGMDALTAAISARIRERYPNAVIQPRRTNSSLWTWLARAAATDANLIVYATDGDMDDQPTPAIRQTLAAGPPAILVDVRSYPPTHHRHRNSFRPLAEATGGTTVPAARRDDVAEAVLAYLERNLPDLPPYRLDYGAPSLGPGDHTVTLRTSDGRVTATGTYTVPQAPAVPPELCGLYVTVQVGRDSVTRILAGFDPNRHTPDEVTREMVTDTLGACFGTHLLSFEAGAPTMSAWLDDFISAKLSVEPLLNAANDGDLAAIEASLADGVLVMPPDLRLQAVPLPRAVTDRSLTFETGPRVMLVQGYPRLNTDRFVSAVDILPGTRFATAAEDPVEAFRITLANTARFAVAEAAFFDTSTASLLAGSALVDMTALQRNQDIAAPRRQAFRALAAAMPGRNHQLAPASGAPLAFWNVDAQTGSLLGVLADGSGGGRQEQRILEFLSEYDRVMSMYNHLLFTAAGPALSPIGGFALGVVAQYGQSLVRIYGAASIAVTIMDASGIEAAVIREVQRLSCEVTKATFTSVLGFAGEAFSTLELLIGALGGDSPFSC